MAIHSILYYKSFVFNSATCVLCNICNSNNLLHQVKQVPYLQIIHYIALKFKSDKENFVHKFIQMRI